MWTPQLFFYMMYLIIIITITWCGKSNKMLSSERIPLAGSFGLLLLYYHPLKGNQWHIGVVGDMYPYLIPNFLLSCIFQQIMSCNRLVTLWKILYLPLVTNGNQWWILESLKTPEMHCKNSNSLLLPIKQWFLQVATDNHCIPLCTFCTPFPNYNFTIITFKVPRLLST